MFTAVAPLTVTKERSEVMTFAYQITEIYHQLFIKSPEGTQHFESYVIPLTNYAWIGVVFWILVGSLVLFFISQYLSILTCISSTFGKTILF